MLKYVSETAPRSLNPTMALMPCTSGLYMKTDTVISFHFIGTDFRGFMMMNVFGNLILWISNKYFGGI